MYQDYDDFLDSQERVSEFCHALEQAYWAEQEAAEHDALYGNTVGQYLPDEYYLTNQQHEI